MIFTVGVGAGLRTRSIFYRVEVQLILRVRVRSPVLR